MEVHVQLNTKTKLFCGCALAREDAEPNTHTCDTCLGFPGSKPRLNKEAVIAALKIALALNCKIPSEMFFSRKTYFYPDMSKDYQITQYEIPVAKDGKLEIQAPTKKIKIRRIQIEEDPAKLMHVNGNITNSDYVLIDYNRSGTPLVEIVTDPDFESPREARMFMQNLAVILEYLGVHADEATIKADANVSVTRGKQEGIRVEVKNVGSFRDIEDALNYEIVRQKTLLDLKQKVERETRGYDSTSKTTRTLRSKEQEEDYGYIFEPDITRINIGPEFLRTLKRDLPELPQQRMKRFVEEFEIERAMASAIITEQDLADAFEHTAKKMDAAFAARWFAGPIKKVLNYAGVRLKDSKITQDAILDLLFLLRVGKITDRTGELILRELIAKGGSTLDYVKGEEKVTDEEKITEVVRAAMQKHSSAVMDYARGEEKAFEFIVGQVMRELKGRGDPAVIRKILKKKLKK